MLDSLFLVTFVLVTLASVAVWTRAILRIRSGGVLLKHEAQSGVPFGLLDVAIVFLFWFIAQTIAVFAFAAFSGIDLQNPDSMSANQQAWLSIFVAVGQLIGLLVTLGLMWMRYQHGSVFCVAGNRIETDVWCGVVALVMVLPGVLSVQWLMSLFVNYDHSTLEMLVKNSNTLTVIAAWLGAVIVAPIWEEFFFRGVLQGWLQRLTSVDAALADPVLLGGWHDSQSPDLITQTNEGFVEAGPAFDVHETGDDSNPYASPNEPLRKRQTFDTENVGPNGYWPILISSALFGLAHLGQGAAPIPLFLFGIALGYLYHRTGSVVSCIVLHFLFNGFNLFWFTLQVMLGEP